MKLEKFKHGIGIKLVLLLLLVELIMLIRSPKLKSESKTYSNYNYEICLHGLISNFKEYKKENRKYIDSVEVKVVDLTDSTIYLISYTNKIGAFFIRIPFQHEYEIKLSKYGWQERNFKINTIIDKKHQKQFHLFLDAELLKESDNYNSKKSRLKEFNIYYDREERRFLYTEKD